VPGVALENAMRVTLPLGISFYTFQSMSYSIDVYRGHTRAMRSANDFFCFVAMFHQLVAGPIVRFSEVADQLKARRHTIDKFARGVALFSLGLAMKVLLANPCGKIADTVFDAQSVSTLDAWYGTVAYSLQILFDFSGYSEMAIGLGLMMGFVFAKNFETPYQSQSITEFWRRWHISLSTWLRDYLYVPLGGNRKGPPRTYINLLLTMLLAGFGMARRGTFCCGAACTAAQLALERAGGRDAFLQRGPRCCASHGRLASAHRLGVLSRARPARGMGASAKHAWSARCARKRRADCGRDYQPYYLICFVIAVAVAWSFPTAWAWTQKLTGTKACVCMALFWLSLVMLATQEYNPFIYFIF
jgi:alginate O-acetyltransferase complex protein AlgI